MGGETEDAVQEVVAFDVTKPLSGDLLLATVMKTSVSVFGRKMSTFNDVININSMRPNTILVFKYKRSGNFHEL